MFSRKGKSFVVVVVVCPLFWAVTTRAFTATPPTTTRRDIAITGGRCGESNKFGLLASKDANMTEEEREAAMEKALKAMTSFSNKYIENTGTYYCSDKSIPAVVIKGLAEHKVTLGTPLCPCRFYEDKEKEAQDGYWNW
jgi:hypothetical protein